MSDPKTTTGPSEATLLSRVVDRRATPADWEELTAQADSDPALWQRLGATLRDDCLLQVTVRAREHTTGRVDAIQDPPTA